MKERANIPGVGRTLSTKMVEKVWGRTHLPEPFKAPDGARVGEIWFEPPEEMRDLLVKYLFTSEKLSVQVHPSTQNAQAGEEGNEECWLVLDAKPGARLAIGFDQEHSAQTIEAAARDGSIEDLLMWHEAAVGDLFYLPAGTVHAIGPGLALLEVQQNSDTTFRLYDYGRPRKLHLDRALAVADRRPYDACHKGMVADRGVTLIDGPHFRLDRVEGAPDAACLSAYAEGVLALPLEGTIALRKGVDSTQTLARDLVGVGECLYAPSLSAIDFSSAGVTLLTGSR